MGVLYDASIPALVVFALAVQLVSLPFFLWTARLLGRPARPAAT